MCLERCFWNQKLRISWDTIDLFAFSYLQQDPGVLPLHSQTSELWLALCCQPEGELALPSALPALRCGATAACSLQGSPGAADAQERGSSFSCGFGGDGCLPRDGGTSEMQKRMWPLWLVSLPFWKALWKTKSVKILPCCILKTLKFWQFHFFWEFLIVWQPCCIKVAGTNFCNVNDNNNFPIIKAPWVFS